MTRGRYLLFTAAAAATLATQTGVQAQAQEAGATASDEIIVTATRRETALQDVAIAVTPVTAELIQNSGIRDLQDLTSVAPALQFNVSENESSATARLRGIGTQGSNPGLESAVGIFVDGVYRARNGVALTDLGEVSQIEVLRGPQGTLFGKNTSAGLISVRTAGPDLQAFGGNAELTYGDYNEQRIAGSITGPIVEDKLGFRLFAASAKRDGFIDAINATGGRTDFNTRDVWTVRGQLAWNISEDADLRIIADYSKRDELCCGAKIYNPGRLNGATNATFPPAVSAAVASLGGYGPQGVAALGNGDIGDRFGFSNRMPVQKIEDKGISAELNWNLGGVTLTSVTAYRNWEFDQGQDSDFSAADIWYRPGDGSNGFSFETVTQEVRLAGTHGRLDWLVGAFYADELLKRDDILILGTQYQAFYRAAATGTLAGAPFNQPLPTAASNAATATAALAGAIGAGQRDHHKQDAQSIAVFTHNIIALDDKTDLTLGLRYTQDEKTLKSSFRTPFSGAAAFTALSATPLAPLAGTLYRTPWVRADLDAVGYNRKRTEEEFSGIVSLRRALTEDLSVYGSYSRGYKSGGFNLDRDFDGDSSFPGEFVDAYEIGAKSQWLDGNLIVNLAVFYNEYEDFQLNRFDGTSFVVTSIPKVEALGVEGDVIWRTPVKGLNMQGGFAYTEAEYGDDAVAGLPRLRSARLTNAPLWTLTDALTYERPLFNGSMTGLAYLDARYVSSQNTGSDLNPTKIQPDYVLVNGRIGLRTADERIGVELWARNLLDEEYAQIMFDQPLQTGAFGAFLGDPRTYGVTLRVQY